MLMALPRSQSPSSVLGFQEMPFLKLGLPHGGGGAAGHPWLHLKGRL